MDALKTAEVRRMEFGGNAPWREFFDAHPANVAAGTRFEECTIAERYEGPVGEEWKERLTARVEGKEYVTPDPPPPQQSSVAGVKREMGSRTNTPSLPSSSSRSSGTPQRAASPGQKSRNESFFARMGEANAARPDHLAPSQGGKFAGFGSTPSPPVTTGGAGLDDFQRDPVAALSKGFSWLSTTVSQHATNVNNTYIRPGVRSFQEGDLAAQAQRWGGAAQEQFQRFVDPDHHHPSPSQQKQQPRGAGEGAEPEKKDFWDSFGRDPAGPPREKRGFWDEFAQAGEARMQQARQPGAGGKGPTSIGTSAMKTGGGSGKKEDGGGGGDAWGEW